MIGFGSHKARADRNARPPRRGRKGSSRVKVAELSEAEELPNNTGHANTTSLGAPAPVVSNGSNIDTNQDVVVSKQANDNVGDELVITSYQIREGVRSLRKAHDGMFDLLKYLLFVALYFTILILQRDWGATFSFETALEGQLNAVSSTMKLSEVREASDIYDYIAAFASVFYRGDDTIGSIPIQINWEGIDSVWPEVGLECLNKTGLPDRNCYELYAFSGIDPTGVGNISEMYPGLWEEEPECVCDLAADDPTWPRSLLRAESGGEFPVEVPSYGEIDAWAQASVELLGINDEVCDMRSKVATSVMPFNSGGFCSAGNLLENASSCPSEVEGECSDPLEISFDRQPFRGGIARQMKIAGFLQVTQERYAVVECGVAVNQMVGEEDDSVFSPPPPGSPINECIDSIDDNTESFTGVIANSSLVDYIEEYDRFPFSMKSFSMASFSSSSIDNFGVIFDLGILNCGKHTLDCELEFLRGFNYIDRQTKSVTLKVPVLNSAGNGLFGGIEVKFDVDVTGRVEPNVVIHSTEMRDMYLLPADWARFVLEMIFVGWVFLFFLQEFKEIHEGGAAEYFDDCWNVLDAASIVVFAFQIALYIEICLSKLNFALPGVTTKTRSSWQAVPTGLGSVQWNEWVYYTSDAVGELEHFSQAIADVERDASRVLHLEDSYKLLNVVSFFLVSVKLFKYFRADSRLAIVTDTLTNAGSDLVHFFIVFALMMACFSAVGFLAFGSSHSEHFYAPWQELLLTAMGNQNIKELRGTNPHVTYNNPLEMCYFWLWTILATVLLMNVLLSIVIDSFAEVRDNIKSQKEGTNGGVLTTLRQMFFFRCYALLNAIQTGHSPSETTPTKRLGAFAAMDELSHATTEPSFNLFTNELERRTGLPGWLVFEIALLVASHPPVPSETDGDDDDPLKSLISSAQEENYETTAGEMATKMAIAETRTAIEQRVDHVREEQAEMRREIQGLARAVRELHESIVLVAAAGKDDTGGSNEKQED